ncbi:MAG: hypothetical protein OHK0039_47830 [Bacteroidia bacterium]
MQTHFDRIEAYLCGELDEAQTQAMEAAMAEDAALRAAVAAHRATLEARLEALEDQIAAGDPPPIVTRLRIGALAELAGQTPEATAGGRVRTLLPTTRVLAWAAAVAVLVLVGLAWWAQRQTPQRPQFAAKDGADTLLRNDNFALAWTEITDRPLRLSDSLLGDPVVGLRSAERTWLPPADPVSTDWVTRLEQAPGRRSPVAQLYLTHAWIRAGDFDRATRNLPPLPTAAPTAFAAHREWLLALIQLGQQASLDARATLTDLLAVHPDFVYASEAVRLLEFLPAQGVD